MTRSPDYLAGVEAMRKAAIGIADKHAAKYRRQPETAYENGCVDTALKFGCPSPHSNQRTMMMSEEMTKAEFIRRFIFRLYEVSASIRYAETNAQFADIAGTYWDDPEQRAEGPEECSDADYSYWEN